MEEIAMDDASIESHHYNFHVSGPHHLSTKPLHIINSPWLDAKYKARVMACLVRAIYLLELDRQSNRIEENAFAPNWWQAFKYKLVETFKDESGSIFGATFVWDFSAAFKGYVFTLPKGAPSAILALRGPLLKRKSVSLWSSLFRHKSGGFEDQLEDELGLVPWNNLNSYARFNVAIEALKPIVGKYGGVNVCVVGHSVGAVYALRMRSELDRDVETHAFNPPVALPTLRKHFGSGYLSGLHLYLNKKD